jgi:hypothetical protein
MVSFLTKFATVVRGVLSGFDRLFFAGTLRGLSYVNGLQRYLWDNRIPFKDFAAHSQVITTRLEEASLKQAHQLGREIRYLNSAQHSKEDIARQIAQRDRIRRGLICVLRSVDPCMSFQVCKNHQTRKLELRYQKRKCVHLYHYQIHPLFGFMHARIQTWFPFRIYVCINGREWLARQMDQVRMPYVRRDNTFTWVQDLTKAQALLDQQLQAHWPELLNELAQTLNPAHAEIFPQHPQTYYWSADQSEWASDVVFHSRTALQEIYSPLVRYAIMNFGAAAILRFLGHPVPVSGKVPHRYRHEVSSNVKERVEGTRIKHWLHGNSLKMYDKGSVLRVETMLHQPKDFKVYRAAEGNPDGPKEWRQMRRGIADLQRRAEVSQAANERYLEALTAVHATTLLRQLVEPLCRPAPAPARRPASPLLTAATTILASDATPANPPVTPRAPATRAVRARRVRALNPLAAHDAALLEAVSRPEFLINGLRNRDLRRLLYDAPATTPSEQRRQSAAVTRQLRLLRAHGLIHKVPKTHRYLVSETGQHTITALLAARKASTEELIRYAG